MYLRCLRSLVFLSVVFVLIPGFSQTFAPAKLSPLVGGSDFAAGDFNHDGLLDVVTVNASTNQVSILLGNGDGTFRPGGVQTVPGAVGLGRLVIGDFNHDGNLDVAVLDTGRTDGGAAIYLLFGDGTGLLGLPTGNYSAPATPNSIAAGDFNNDGATDLAVLSQTADRSSAAITLLINNGSGAFASSSITGLPQPFATANPNFGESDSLGELVAGDFDGDGRMDLLYRDSCFGCDISQEPLFLLKNIPGTTGTTPGFAFAPAQPHDSYTGSRRLRVFDVDGDGRADVVAAYDGCHTPCSGIGVIYSNADGTTSRGGIVIDSPNFGDLLPLDVVVGDFNNDGIMDLAAPITGGTDGNFNQIPNGIAVWTGKGGRTGFPSAPSVGFNDPVYFPLADNANPFAIGAGFIDGDHNKDIFTLNGDGTIAAFLNTTNAGDPCPYPDQPGVNFCLPADGSTALHPTRIVASARGATQPVNRIEVWIDGHKQTQVFNDKLDITLNLGQAQHTVELVEVDATGAFLKARHTFTVGSGTVNGCPSPSSPGVQVCAPHSGGPFDPPIRFVATGTGASGSVQKMQLRIDGKQQLETPGDQLDASLTLSAGPHEAIIVEVDSAGGSLPSNPVDFVVNGPPGSCPLPATTGVHFCEPAVDGGTYDNPVSITASANVPNLTLLRLYENDQVAFETTDSLFTLSIDGPPEQLRLVVVAYDSSGNVYVDRRTITLTGQPQGQCVATLFPSAHICTPGDVSTSASPLHVRAGAAISNLQLFRLYVDDAPVFETASSSIDTNVTLPLGSHHLVVVAYNGDGTFFTDSVTTTVTGTVQNCPAPGTDRSIAFCSPVSGTVSSPVNITAQGRWDHFPITHMRVYVDNKPAFDANNPQDGYLNTQLALASGKHTIVIVAWNQRGESIVSLPHTITVL